MSATTVFAVGFGALILGHWANNEPTINTKTVIEMGVSLVFIAALDGNPETAPVAKGFAWLFLAAVLLSNKSILTALAKRTGTGTAKAA